MANVGSEKWIEENGRKLAEYVLDEYECDGKTIREWVRMMGKQKTARWIPRKADGLEYTNEFACSECGMTVYMNWLAKRCDYEYCPFCGRKVEEQGEERVDET